MRHAMNSDCLPQGCEEVHMTSLQSRLAAVALACVAFVAPVHADESQQDGPSRQFKDEFIENLLGDWMITRAIRGEVAQNTLAVEWVLNHQFLQLHMKDVAKPPAYEALVLIGYQHADKRYIAHWCDTYGGRFSAVGYGKRSGDSIEFEFQYADGPFFNTFSWDAKAKEWTFTMESSSADGKRSLFAVDKLRRR